MDSDARRAVLIGAILVAAVAGVAGWIAWRDAGRLQLAELRVVSATAADPVFREGARHLAPDEPFALAAVMRLEDRRGRSTWVAPVEELEIDGTRVPLVTSDRWPEDDRLLRVLWFTIESARLGGELGAEPGDALAYRTFLAPELGRGLRTQVRDLEAHIDDGLAVPATAVAQSAGTLRYYARVEVVTRMTAVRSEQSASSLGPDHLLDPRLPTVSRSLAAPVGIDPAVGELFLLPSFEAAARSAPPGTTVAMGLGFDQLVQERLAVSSLHLAAAARSDLEPDILERLPVQAVLDLRGPPSTTSRALRWEVDVRAGSLLRVDSHWLVLLADDGDGIIDGGDLALHAWRRPALVEPIAGALGTDAARVELLDDGR